MKSSYNGKAVPSEGKPIATAAVNCKFQTRPSFHLSKATVRARHLEGVAARIRRAVEHAYGGKRRVAWFEVFAGEKAFKAFNEWLPKRYR